MRKVLNLILLLLLCLAIIISGCSQKSPASNEGSNTKTSSEKPSDSSDNKSSSTGDESIVTPAGTFPIVKEKVTLTVFTPQNSLVEDYETNKLTRYLEEKTNVHIDWMLAPAKDANTKVNLLLASNSDLPDIFLGEGLITNDTLVKYASQNIFVPLNKYIEEYGVEFKRVMEYPGFEDLPKKLTAPDGNIYAIPKLSICYNCEWRQKMWINQKFLDALGLDMPETTDDFYNVLKAFKEKDPNGNGKADEIPLAGAITGWKTNIDGFLMNAFIYNDGDDRFIVNDGKVDVVYNKPEWREGLAYMRKLCSEGLLDPASFTQDGAQLRQLGENEIPILGAAPGGSPHEFTNASGERRLDYVALTPLKGPNGVQFTGYYPTNPRNAMVITSACKYPEVAYRWGDYQLSEEISVWSRFGEPEVDWRKPNEGEIGINGKPAYLVPILLWGSVQNSHWHFSNPGFSTAEMQSGQAFDPDGPPNMERILYVVTEEQYDGYEPDHDSILPPLFFTEEEAAEYTELKTLINDYVKESIARFVTGDMDIEKEWDNYVKELDNMGLARYIEITQTAYDRQYGSK